VSAFERPIPFYKTVFLRSIGLVTPLAIWEWASQSGAVNERFVPPPTKVLPRAIELMTTGELTGHLWITLREIGIALGLSLIVGIILGTLIGRSRLIAGLAEPVVWFFLSTPLVAFVAVFVAMYGIGETTVIALGFLGGFVYITANTATGVREVDPVLMRTGRVFGAGRWAMFVKILVPSALPHIVTGIRLAIGRVIIGVLVGEFFASSGGLGYQVIAYGNFLRMTELWSVVVWLAVIGASANVISTALERRFSSWKA
jgi:sulfonate transport system permease protein